METRILYTYSTGLAKAIIELSQQYIEVIDKLQQDHDELLIKYNMLKDEIIAKPVKSLPNDADAEQNYCIICKTPIPPNRKVCSNRCRAAYATKKGRDKAQIAHQANNEVTLPNGFMTAPLPETKKEQEPGE